MNKSKAIILYRVTVSVFRKWLDEGIISMEEFMKIDALFADKYGLPKMSIYR